MLASLDQVQFLFEITVILSLHLRHREYAVVILQRENTIYTKTILLSANIKLEFLSFNSAQTILILKSN